MKNSIARLISLSVESDEAACFIYSVKCLILESNSQLNVETEKSTNSREKERVGKKAKTTDETKRCTAMELA